MIRPIDRPRPREGTPPGDPGDGSSAARPAPLAQMARFATSGGVVAALYISTTTILIATGVHPQIALAVGYVAGLALHFTLNRQFVFVSSSAFSHRLSTQATRYLIVAATAYAVTAIALAVLPGALAVSEVAVFITVTVMVTVVNFVTLRSWVFHRSRENR